MTSMHWYLHVDLDAFFASVEQLDNPEYRGKPVIVGGRPEDKRSVVSTASYEARKFGVHSAMPTYQAYKLCPQGIFVRGRMDRYSQLSYQIMEIFKNYSPDVDQMSIDEAFIDLTGTENLFGPPEETARKIKAQVKQETGLTVSIGLATTKYLAKIGSGFSKPDGFYFIHPGDEEKFMLSLPLNKVWGLGPKSLELLKSKSILTTRDIYDKPYETLEFLFGKNMATFLFNVVRGNEKESFNNKPKNHSISGETTFPLDLTDVYTIETKILELAQSVYFRLLKHNAYSRTATLKIRYDDFSTCSVQETLDHNIQTLDSYFEILKRLFEKKFENGRGIRLLGVGFDNVESEEKPFQQELFENSDEKKQAVEKAILKLNKKHPEIHVHKARTLKSVGFFILLSLSKPFSASAEEKVIQQQGAAAVMPDTFYTPSEAPETLFNWEITDKDNVEFNIEGYWQGLFTGSLLASFGNGTDFTYSLGTPVFKQEVQLSTWVLLNKHWYFQADFAEEFTKNTLTLGYKGDYYLRSAKISNRSITMPSGYSASAFGFGLEGGENQAPGFSSHWESPFNTWEADFLIRYDMTETHSQTYYGMNSVSQTSISLEDFLYGYCYQLPDNTENELSQIKDIYVQSNQGQFTDSEGRKFKKLSLSDYSVINSQRKIYLSSSANAQKNENGIPMVIVTFINSAITDNIITKTGSYKDSSSYAGKIQSQFSYNLEDYTSSLSTTIENHKALVIQSPQGISPYVRPDFYDCGLSSNSDFIIINENTDQIIKEFVAQESQEDITALHQDFFKEKHIYARVSNLNCEDTAYPFAQICPEIYLNLKAHTPLKLLVRTYSPVSELQIGTNASAGSVVVYRNNLIETGAVYNPSTGIVTLQSSVSNTDKIVITWQEDSEDFTNGAITGGAGFKINFTDNLRGDAAVTTSWPLTSNQDYSTPENLRPGFAAFSTGIEFETTEKEFFISDKTAIALQKDNGAKKLLVKAQENVVPQTNYLESSSGFSTKTEPVLTIGNSKIYLNKENNCTSGNHKGQSDSKITGSKIPLSWNFSNNSNGWASVDVQLSEGNKLKDASKVSFAIKPEISASDTSNYEVYIQLGIKASSDFFGEEVSSIPTWKITDLNLKDNSWQTVTFSLNDSDRAHLVSSHDARLIITKTDNLPGTSGTIYAGPYEIVSQSVFTRHDDKIKVNTFGSARSTKSFSSVINWNIDSDTAFSSLSDSSISTVSYFSPSDFSDYENITFDFSICGYNQGDIDGISNSPALSLILDSADIDSANNSTALKLTLNNTQSLFSDTLSYHSIRINQKNHKVFIDDNELSASEYNLYINSSVVPSRQTVIINTVTDNKIYRKGSFYLNDLCYTDSKIYGTAQNKLEVNYKKELDNVSFFGNFTSSQSTGKFDKINFTTVNSAKTGVSVAGVDLQVNASTKNTDLTNAGHSVKTIQPVAGIISVEEDYNFSKQDKTLRKSDGFKLDFSKIQLPLQLSADSTAQYDKSNQKQNLNGSTKYTLGSDSYNASVEAKLELHQKISNLFDKTQNFDTNNYFNGWYNISTLEFSEGKSNALLRNEKLSGQLEGHIPFCNFTPVLTYTLSGNYNKSNETSLKDSTILSLSLPFTFSITGLSFNFERNGDGITTVAAGGNYKSDSEKVFDLQKDRTWVYSSIPFYELFDEDLKNKVSASYSTKYETKFSRKLSNDYSDIYTPSAATLAVIRTIKSNENKGDLYQFKAEITNTSLNNFGSESINQPFTWFKSEELISSLTSIVKMPADIKENTTWSLTAYVQLMLYITDKAAFTSAWDLSFETDMSWSSHLTAIYSRPGKTSFLSELANYFISDDKKIDFEIIRKENFNMELNYTEKKLRQKYSYSHNIDYKFLKYFTVMTGIGGSFINTQNTASIMGLEASIGGKAEF